MSQPSSPTHSRTGSPTRHQNQLQQQTSSQAQPQMIPVTSQMLNQSSHRNNRPLRNVRPSAETTPPPLLSQQSAHHLSGQGSGTIFMGNDNIMAQNIKSFEEVSFVEKSPHNHKMMKTRLNKDNWFEMSPALAPYWKPIKKYNPELKLMMTHTK